MKRFALTIAAAGMMLTSSSAYSLISLHSMGGISVLVAELDIVFAAIGVISLAAVFAFRFSRAK